MSSNNLRTMISINKPSIGEEERNEIRSVLDENALTSSAKDGGKRVRDFESLLRDYLKAKHVITVNSGTASLYAARYLQQMSNKAMRFYFHHLHLLLPQTL